MVAYNDLVYTVVLVFCSVAIADFETEYFYGKTLRAATKELTCDNEELKLYCEKRCGGNHACLFGKCFCLQSKDDIKDSVEKPAIKEDKFIDFDDYTEMTRKTRFSSSLFHALMPAETFPKRPALRHHIAHFCPNLEEARKCIRSCMKLGKPAFCGKEHVCYCGHRSETPDGEQLDVKKIYGQFRDLYTKYFGAPDYYDDEYYYDH